jgi:WD40 repeat protein
VSEKPLKFLLTCAFLFILFSSLIINIEVSYADLIVFDETVVYGLEKEGQPVQRAIGTISFATNGTLFANHEHNVYKLVNGKALDVCDVRPKKNSEEYYDLGSYYGIAVAPNGTLYVSVNNGSYGWIYKVVNGKVFWETYVYKRLGQVKELAFRPDGELFYTDGESIYSVTKGEVFTWNSIWEDKITISSIAFAPDGTLFASVRYDHPKYDLIVKRVDDGWRLVYVRPVRIGQWGIDNVAISPNDDIYFEDHDPYWGQLYKLVYKSQISLENGDFYLGSMYPVVSNSTILDYSYSVNELKLNVTGVKGTRGAFILPVFRCNYPDGLEVQVEANGSPLEFDVTESSVAYLVFFVYSHDNVTSLKISLTGIKPHSYGPDIFTPEFSIVLIGIIFAIIVSVVAYRRKTRAYV